VAGELADCIRSLKRYYPAVRPEELAVTIIQNIDGLLPELPPALAGPRGARCKIAACACCSGRRPRRSAQMASGSKPMKPTGRLW